MKYTFPKHMFLSVMDHANSLDIVIQTVLLNGDTYHIETQPAFPEEQLEHLELTVEV